MNQSKNQSTSNSSTKTNQKTFTQQVFHPALFNRPRSASLSEISKEASQMDQISTNVVDLTEKVLSPQDPPPWQRVPISAKRKRTSDSPPSASHVTVSNKFATLPLDQLDNQNNDTNQKVIKPPPIILYGIEDVNELSKLIESVCDPQLFKIKIVNKNLLRVLVECSTTYKDVISIIRANGLIGHTFTQKDKKAYRIVIKKLHHTTPHSEIINAIEATGNKVRGQIINARYGPDKTPTFTFFVNLEPSENNKAVKNIKYIHNQCVTIENPRKSTTIVQCQRCQQYGHSKNNCMRPYRCVKCGEGHKTADCPKKDRNTPAKCALCQLDHPANYKGCQVYQEISTRKAYRNKNYQQESKNKSIKTEPIVQSQAQSQTTQSRDKPRYSDITANRRSSLDAEETDQPNMNYQQSNIEKLLIKQSEKIEQLIQQIGILINLLTTVISKQHS